MSELPRQTPDWTAYCQLIQQLIAGNVRRNTFSRWEMDLLLDFQLVRLRNSARSEMLRRYLKAVQRQIAMHQIEPLPFSRFFEMETSPRPAAQPPVEKIVLPRAS